MSDLLTIHEYYKGLNSYYGIDSSKLLSLSFNLINNEHEVLGHLNIRIQSIINRKEIKSPSPNINSKNLKERKEGESGDYIEELLYGSNLNNLSYKEILFILDLDNYDCSYDEFRNKFLKCNDCDVKISKNFNDLINSLKIQIDTNPNDNTKIYNISQKLSKNNEKEYTKPLQHKRGAFHYSPELKMKYEKQFKHILEVIEMVKKEKNNNTK